MKATSQIDFSVIVATYNRAAMLPRALDSILEQSFAAREIIVVDDGSSDGTASLMRYCYPQVRYRYIRHSGVSAARNCGIAAAKSSWLAFLDSDDSWQSDKLARQAALITETPGLRWLHTNETWIRDGRVLGQKPRHRKTGGNIFDRALQLCCVSPSAVAIEREVFSEFGMFDESLKACEDYDLWLRIAAKLPIGFVDAPLVVKYGGHDDQLSRRTPTLDYYRIAALGNLIASGRLGRPQADAAMQMLRQKVRIFVTGARKRGRDGAVAAALNILDKTVDRYAAEYRHCSAE